MVQWHSISHLARTLKKKLWASCYLNVGWNNKCVKLLKRVKVTHLILLLPFFCSNTKSPYFSLQSTYESNIFCKYNFSPTKLCKYARETYVYVWLNLVFNISICVNFFYIYKQCNFLVQKQSTCKSLKGKSMQLFSYFRKSTEGFAVLLQLCVKVHLLMTCFAN